jgi:hypothetical protein
LRFIRARWGRDLARRHRARGHPVQPLALAQQQRRHRRLRGARAGVVQPGQEGVDDGAAPHRLVGARSAEEAPLLAPGGEQGADPAVVLADLAAPVETIEPVTSAGERAHGIPAQLRRARRGAPGPSLARRQPGPHEVLAEAERRLRVVGAAAAASQRRDLVEPDRVLPLARAAAADAVEAACILAARRCQDLQVVGGRRGGAAHQRLERAARHREVAARRDAQGVGGEGMRGHADPVARGLAAEHAQRLAIVAGGGAAMVTVIDDELLRRAGPVHRERRCHAAMTVIDRAWAADTTTATSR